MLGRSYSRKVPIDDLYILHSLVKVPPGFKNISYCFLNPRNIVIAGNRTGDYTLTRI